MPAVLFAVVVTFMVTVLWQLLATKKMRANQHLMATALIKEIEGMAKKLGYPSLEAYFTEDKGREYAATATVNLPNFIASFTARGAG